MTYEQFIAALTIWREGSGVSHDARLGMYHTIRNRVAKPGWWGNDLVSVCTKPYQYSSMTALGDPNLKRWPVKGESTFVDCMAIVSASVLMDVTGGATHYYTVPLTAPPKEWGQNVKETMVINGVHFCQLGE